MRSISAGELFLSASNHYISQSCVFEPWEQRQTYRSIRITSSVLALIVCSPVKLGTRSKSWTPTAKFNTLHTSMMDVCVRRARSTQSQSSDMNSP